MPARWSSNVTARTSDAKIRAHRFGLRAEAACCLWLRAKGYRILAVRERTPQGEIDIVARRGRTLAFIEVKARPEMRSAIESVTPQKQSRLVAAAESYLSRHAKYAGLDLRFDLMVVVPWRLTNHIVNAWSA